MPWWTVHGVAIERPPSESRLKMSQDNKLHRYLVPRVHARRGHEIPGLAAFAARSM